MSVSRPSQGTHFSDGVRTGPEFGSTFVPGANVLTPSVMVSSPTDSLPPGVFNTPMSLLDIIPTPVVSNSIAAAQTPGAAGYLTLATINVQGITLKTYQGIANVIQLDVARNVTITGTGGTTLSLFTVFGWDQYGVPMVEQISGPIGATKASGNKAFLYIQAVYSSAGTTAAVSVGVGNTFGFGHLVPSQNYAFVPYWNGNPDGAISGGALANNSLATTNATTLVTVTLTGAATGPTTTAGLVVGQWISITGATGPLNSVPAVQLNITAQIVSIPSTATFTYSSNVVASGSGAGGGAGINWTHSNTVITGAQLPATATTGDVRGTYTPIYNAEGFSRLTINYYSPSGDGRNYNNANNGTLILDNNPIITQNGTLNIVVYAPNHQLTTGESITISGATTTNAVTAGQLNITAPVTVIDANYFGYTASAGASATSSGVGGGTIVSITPRYGDLYQENAGRFGVTQYSIPLF